jgi:acyl-CoA synthetase (AMP-forming)/AMP-acid ligase II/3-oxoacyl-(acyl-carrier-protein) synthase/acyl carrier protein
MYLHQKHSAIVELLRIGAASAPDRTVFIFLKNGEQESGRLTYAQLDIRARAIAAKVQSLTNPGDRVLLLYPAGLEFICAFMGCLYAGVIAVPAHPPLRSRSVHRVQSISQDANPSLALTDSSSLLSMERRLDEAFEVRQFKLIATDVEPESAAAHWKQPAIGADSLALLQYTSGSTGTPKGVMITHRNIMSNIKVIAGVGCADETTVSCSWLPFFHDMGLFGKILTPIYLGCLSVLMEPASFIQKPLRWLQGITKYRATVCAAPDSAFDLCVRKISAADKAGLDLSSWRIAFNGAEPVRSSTIERFLGAFASCGFRRETMRPVYGMAEATLLVAGQVQQLPPVVKEFDTDSFSKDLVSQGQSRSSRSLVSCGQAWEGHYLRIVSPETGLLCPANEIGEIWVSGPSVGAGYWNRPDESERTFHARLAADDSHYLRTGDLGLLDDNGLFVTGRLKDLIIVAGRNLYPQDLERTTEESDPTLASNASAAFSVEVDGEERIVLALEVRREAMRRLNADTVAANIRRALSEEHEASLYSAVFLKPGSIPRTSSGKIQRGHVRTAYLRGEGLEILAQWSAPKAVDRETSTWPGKGDVEAWLLKRISLRCGIAEAELDPRAPFSTYGLDSRDAIALSGEFEEYIGRPLSPTLLYDYPNIALLAQKLAGHSVGAAGEAPDTGTEGIAIIGMACRFPGASDPEAFWQLLKEGRDAVADSPRRVSGLPPTGMLKEVDCFDAELFGINAREAQMMDPQQRLLLEVAWEAIENAGVAPVSLAGSRIAVAVGISACDYARLAWQKSVDTGPYATTGSALSIAANRISYAFDLRGPSWAVDTACSSSLVAIHQACRALQRGECDAALVGGANLILSPQLSMAFTQSGMLSPDGKCRTFDEKANGYVRGEGVGVVFLKRLSDALRDGDPIQAAVRGTAANQDGRSNGLTAPNGPSQQAVIREALRAAGVVAREIGMVEAHGTGTLLGDPIELNALMEVLGEGRTTEDLCWVGSVKTNIGHLEAAAGIAGLIKTVLALKHCEVPRHLHFRAINPYIAIAGKPFCVPEHATPWKTGKAKRLAGVSSFGFGGTNAHVILEEAPPRPERSTATKRPAHVVAFSARTPAALREIASDYTHFLKTHPETELEDFAFTVNRSRSFLAERRAIVFSDREELLTKLTDEGERHAVKASRPIAFHFRQAGTAEKAVRELTSILPAFRDLLGATQASGAGEVSLPCFQNALGRLWMRFGVKPQAIWGEGHGMEAAHAFALSLEEDLPVTDYEELPKETGWALEISPEAATWRLMLENLAAFYLSGGAVNWATLDADTPCERLTLPNYPFERNRYWIEECEGTHPLLGRRLEQLAHMPEVWAWESQLDVQSAGFLKSHAMHGSAALPSSAYVEMALSAVAQIGEASHSTVAGLSLLAPVFLTEAGAQRMQTVLSRQAGGRFSFAVYRHTAPSKLKDAQWQLCARAELYAGK